MTLAASYSAHISPCQDLCRGNDAGETPPLDQVWTIGRKREERWEDWWLKAPWEHHGTHCSAVWEQPLDQQLGTLLYAIVHTNVSARAQEIGIGCTKCVQVKFTSKGLVPSADASHGDCLHIILRWLSPSDKGCRWWKKRVIGNFIKQIRHTKSSWLKHTLCVFDTFTKVLWNP